MAYQLLINDVEQEVSSFEADHGENHLINATIPYDVVVETTDILTVKIEGVVVSEGEVIKITKKRRQGIKTLTVKGNTRILYDKLVDDSGHISYSGQDAGAIVQDLVDHYFSGVLTSTQVETSTGVTIDDIDGTDMSVGDLIDELCMRAGAVRYVDEDEDVFFDLENAVVSGITISSEDIFDLEDTASIAQKIGTTIVKGKGVSATVGSARPEKLIVENLITTTAEATEVATAIDADFSNERNYLLLETYENPSLRVGQSVVLDSPEDGYSSSTQMVRSVHWEVSSGKILTTVRLGDSDPDLDVVLRKAMTRIRYSRYWQDLDDVAEGTDYVRINQDRGRPDLLGTPRMFRIIGEADTGYTITEVGVGASVTVTKDKVVLATENDGESAEIRSADYGTDFLNEPRAVFRFRSNDFTPTAGIINHQIGITNLPTTNSILIDILDNDIRFKTILSGIGETTSIGTASINTWYHVELIAIGGVAYCYLDGVLVATHSTKVPTSGSAYGPYAKTLVTTDDNISLTIDQFEVSQKW